MPIVHQLVGSVLVLVGAVLAPTPIPLGLIMMTVGLALLAPYIPLVQRLIRAIRRKWPKVDASLRRHHSRFPAVIRAAIDKTHPV